MATQYRYLFADLRTNDILAELPLTRVSLKNTNGHRKSSTVNLTQ